MEFNSIYGSSATEIINSATNNDDGWAVIELGTNSLTIFGVPKENLKPDYFHIIPSINNTITGIDNYYSSGSSEEESLEGTSDNDYIQGSSDPIGRFTDGVDLINGKEGDDVLIGGPNKRPTGGYDSDRYIFDDNSGNDLVIGFLFDGTGSQGGPYNDVIEIPSNVNGSGINSFEDILGATTNNDDGWAVIDLGSGNTITIHGVSKSKLLQRNFVIR